MNKKFRIKEKIFKWTGKGAWFFVRLNKKDSSEIKDHFGMFAKGWGSLPVRVEIGGSKWKTSIFPDKETYLLPIKSQIRIAEDIKEGEELNFHLEVAIDSYEITAPPLN